MTGLTRRSFCDRRAKSTDFAEAWDEALDAFAQEPTHRVVQTALEMGNGNLYDRDEGWVSLFRCLPQDRFTGVFTYHPSRKRDDLPVPRL